MRFLLRKRNRPMKYLPMLSPFVLAGKTHAVCSSLRSAQNSCYGLMVVARTVWRAGRVVAITADLMARRS
jgi:hypothetical protein